MAKKGVFISMTGMQPGSVATAVAALATAGEIGSALLLATPQTLEIAKRLQAWCAKRFPSIEMGLAPISGSHGDAEKFAQDIKQLTGQYPDLPLFLSLGAGMSFFWGMVSRLLLGIDNIVPVFNEVDDLHEISGTRSWPVEDLGLEPLLKLHAIEPAWADSKWDGVVADFRTANDSFSADFAYERKGRFYTLHQDIATLDESRKILNYLKPSSDLGLNGLQPQMTASTQNGNIGRRLKLGGVHVLRTSAKVHQQGKALENDWFGRNPGEPGHPYRYGKEKGDHARPIPKRVFFGKGGGGAPLLVCLGNDPATTLACIYTHRPSRAWVLYDASTPRVVDLARGMAAASTTFPVGTIRFIPIDDGFLGRNITREHLPFLNDEGEIHANVTPGSKPQSWAFGRIPHLRLFSIRNQPHTPCVVPLEDDTDPPLIVDSGPAEVVGRIIGGEGVRVRLREAEIAANLDFLAGASACIETYSDRKGNFYLCDPKTPCSQSKDGARVSYTSEWVQGRIRVTVTEREGDRVLEGSFSAPMEGEKIKADWLEDVAGGAFLRAGGRDLCVGMEWPWDPWNTDHHRTEIDVVFTWKHTHVVVSVKALPLSRKALEEKGHEIKAMAKECFGRFSLPVLVHYAPRKAAIQSHILDRFKKCGVLAIPATLLSHPEQLAYLLDCTVDRLQTTAPNR